MLLWVIWCGVISRWRAAIEGERPDAIMRRAIKLNLTFRDVRRFAPSDAVNYFRGAGSGVVDEFVAWRGDVSGVVGVGFFEKCW